MVVFFCAVLKPYVFKIVIDKDYQVFVKISQNKEYK